MVTLDAGVAGVAGVLGVCGLDVGVFGVRGQRIRGLPRPLSNIDASEVFFDRGAVMLRCSAGLGSVPQRTNDLKAVRPGVHGTMFGVPGLAGGVGRLVPGLCVAEVGVKLFLEAQPGSW